MLNKWITALTGVLIDDYSYVNGCMSGLHNGLMLQFNKLSSKRANIDDLCLLADKLKKKLSVKKTLVYGLDFWQVITGNKVVFVGLSSMFSSIV